MMQFDNLFQNLNSVFISAYVFEYFVASCKLGFVSLKIKSGIWA